MNNIIDKIKETEDKNNNKSLDEIKRESGYYLQDDSTFSVMYYLLTITSALISAYFTSTFLYGSIIYAWIYMLAPIISMNIYHVLYITILLFLCTISLDFYVFKEKSCFIKVINATNGMFKKNDEIIRKNTVIKQISCIIMTMFMMVLLILLSLYLPHMIGSYFLRTFCGYTEVMKFKEFLAVTYELIAMFGGFIIRFCIKLMLYKRIIKNNKN